MSTSDIKTWIEASENPIKPQNLMRINLRRTCRQ